MKIIISLFIWIGNLPEKPNKLQFLGKHPPKILHVKIKNVLIPSVYSKFVNILESNKLPRKTNR